MTDVLVIGGGAAGAAAAIAARDAGADVVLAEQADTLGGNCPYSGGFLVEVDDPGAADHVEALCFGKTPRDVIDAWVSGVRELPGWLSDACGGELSPPLPDMDHYPWIMPSWPSLPGRSRYRQFASGDPAFGPGERLWAALESAVRARGVQPRTATRVQRLLVEDDGAVAGAVLDGEEVRARGGVVLACGSFESDPELRDAYLGPPLVPIGHPGNRGDALALAGQAGASLWHMSAFFGWFCFVHPDFAAGFPLDFHGASFLFVDADANRWSDETGWEIHDRVRSVTATSPRRPNRPVLPLYAIFDGATLAGGPLNGVVGTPNDHRWSRDNSEEIARGWIKRGADAHALAAELGLPGDALAATLDRYARATAAGHDPDFNRLPETLAPLEGELFGIEMRPGVATASGGPRRDGRARVLRPGGEPIGGLYAAGAAGSIWAHLTEHGGGLTDAMVFGRIAGSEAAARAR